MKLQLLCVGKLTEDYLRRGCEEFANRVQRYTTLELHELKEHKSGRKQDIPRIISTEGEKLLQRIPSGYYLIALDERGRSMSSKRLAGMMEDHMVSGVPGWALVIGGPYGLSDEVRKRADLVLSLSEMTLTHQMARLLLLEQLYRCHTIIRNEPYHH